MYTVILSDALEALRSLPEKSVDCCVTSPPYYGLRDYGIDGQVGLEETPTEYVYKLVEVFREVRRVLKDNGTLWLNMGDSYAGSGTRTELPARVIPYRVRKTLNSEGYCPLQGTWNLSVKTLWEYPGSLLWHSVMTAGILGRTLSGTSPTVCPRALKIAVHAPMSIFSCSVNPRNTILIMRR